MYYILYEGLKIESNEPVYCTMYSVQCTVYSVQRTILYIVYTMQVNCTLYMYNSNRMMNNIYCIHYIYIYIYIYMM